MNRRPASSAFLLEMLWVCGFFALASCIFVMAFVKADTMSRGARNLNQAVTADETALEDTFAEYHNHNQSTAGIEDVDTKTIYYDRNWHVTEDTSSSVESVPENAAFSITVTSRPNGGLLEVTAEVFSITGESIYTLNGAHYVPRSLRNQGERNDEKG